MQPSRVRLESQGLRRYPFSQGVHEAARALHPAGRPAEARLSGQWLPRLSFFPQPGGAPGLQPLRNSGGCSRAVAAAQRDVVGAGCVKRRHCGHAPGDGHAEQHGFPGRLHAQRSHLQRSAAKREPLGQRQPSKPQQGRCKGFALRPQSVGLAVALQAQAPASGGSQSHERSSAQRQRQRPRSHAKNAWAKAAPSSVLVARRAAAFFSAAAGSPLVGQARSDPSKS